MLLASPAGACRCHYSYHEGHGGAEPDSFDDLGRQPVALAVVDRSLRQTDARHLQHHRATAAATWRL